MAPWLVDRVNSLSFTVPLLLTLAALSQRADAVIIVDEGEPQAIILTASDTTTSASRAAAELQHFVELMSGAQLPIYVGQNAVPESERDRPRLLVGRSQAITDLGVELPSGHRSMS